MQDAGNGGDERREYIADVRSKQLRTRKKAGQINLPPGDCYLDWIPKPVLQAWMVLPAPRDLLSWQSAPAQKSGTRGCLHGERQRWNLVATRRPPQRLAGAGHPEHRWRRQGGSCCLAAAGKYAHPRLRQPIAPYHPLRTRQTRRRSSLGSLGLAFELRLPD
jgi:hypothetical protein